MSDYREVYENLREVKLDGLPDLVKAAQEASKNNFEKEAEQIKVTLDTVILRLNEVKARGVAERERRMQICQHDAPHIRKRGAITACFNCGWYEHDNPFEDMDWSNYQ